MLFNHFPKISSDIPYVSEEAGEGYISAVSIKLIPESSARSKSELRSLWREFGAPKFMVPMEHFETDMSVFPSLRVSIVLD